MRPSHATTPLIAGRIDLAGIEFIEEPRGNRYVYDINGTTNYSGVLAKSTGIDGMRRLARYLREVVVPQTRRATMDAA